MTASPSPLESRAWLLDGATKSMPGLLHWNGESISYIACGAGKFTEAEIRQFADQLPEAGNAVADVLAEKPTVLLTFRPSDIQSFKMPWYYLKGGIQITVGTHTYKFSFIRPQNTVEPTYYLEDQFRWAGGAGQEDVDILGGKAAGGKWKQLLKAITR